MRRKDVPSESDSSCVHSQGGWEAKTAGDPDGEGSGDPDSVSDLTRTDL